MPSSNPLKNFLTGKLGITHFALQVADVERSLAFYCGILQLEERHRLEMKNVGLTEVFLGGPDGVGGSLDLIHVPNSDDQVAPPKSLLTHVTIEVPNIVELRQRLADAGVAETMAQEVKGMLLLFVTDPDGYHVELLGSLTPEAEPA